MARGEEVKLSKHESMKEFAKFLFESMGYKVEMEEMGNRLEMAGFYPDLILDSKIPVEIGDVKGGRDKMKAYFKEANEAIWIPYPSTLDGPNFKILWFTEENIDKSDLEFLRERNKKLELENRELSGKLRELERYESAYKEILVKMVDQDLEFLREEDKKGGIIVVWKGDIREIYKK